MIPSGCFRTMWRTPRSPWIQVWGNVPKQSHLISKGHRYGQKTYINEGPQRNEWMCGAACRLQVRLLRVWFSEGLVLSWPRRGAEEAALQAAVTRAPRYGRGAQRHITHTGFKSKCIALTCHTSTNAHLNRAYKWRQGDTSSVQPHDVLHGCSWWSSGAGMGWACFRQTWRMQLTTQQTGRCLHYTVNQNTSVYEQIHDPLARYTGISTF